MIQLVVSLLICVLVTSNFVDTYRIFPKRDSDYSDNDEQMNHNMLTMYQKLISNNENLEDDKNWTGRWMPERLGDPTPPPKIWPKNEHYAHDMYMGQVSPECDDAKTNLTVDWDYSPSAYTCYGDYIVPFQMRVHYYCEQIPRAYQAAHKCMNETIEYDSDMPLYGPHRPLWPVYGEYKYLPKQRWLHSLEHGAIVMLYHPCADPMEVKLLKNLVNRCLWRHIITPCSEIDEDYPLALLSWGCRLDLTYANIELAKLFIQERALRGPEKISEDGQFKDRLLRPSDTVTDRVDSTLCPF